MSHLISTPRMQAFDSNGDPLVGGLVYFYESGTSTPKNTYSDADLATPNSNPVVLDSRGEALIFGSGEYKVLLHDSNDVLIYEEDEFYFIESGGQLRADLASTATATKGSFLVGVFLSITDYVGRALSAWIADRPYHPKDFGATANGTADDNAAIMSHIAATPVDGTVDLYGLSYGITGLTISNKITLRNGTLNLLDSATQSAIELTSAADGATLIDIKIVMDTGAIVATDASGFFVNGPDDVTLIRCEADGAVAASLLHAGIYVQGGKNFTARYCVARNSLKEGIITRDTNNVTYIRCKGYDNGLSGVGTSAGIGLLAVDCYGENSGASGLTFNSQNMRIIRPKSKNNVSQNGITIGHNLTDQDAGNVVVEHPEVIGAPEIGMFVLLPYHFTLIGGRFIDCGNTAVKITPEANQEGSVNIHGGLVIDGVANGGATWASTGVYERTDIVVPTTLNGYAYRSIESGTTSGSEPTWPTTLGDTVVDGTVTWECHQVMDAPATIWLPSTAYAVGDRIFSTDFNGYVFDCTTAGTSGVSEPTWDTTISNTTADNTAVWTTTKLLSAFGIEITSGGTPNLCDINILGFDIKNVAGAAIGVTAEEDVRISDGHIRSAARGIKANGSFVNKFGNDVALFVDGDVNTGTDRITVTGHPFNNADPVNVTSYGTVPTGFSVNPAIFYYIKSIDANTVELYTDVGLTSIVDITAATGGGQHYIGTADVRVGSMDVLAINDVTFNNIKRSPIYMGNLSEVNFDNLSFTSVSTDGQGEPIIDQFGSSHGQARINLPMASPLAVRNCPTLNIDASSTAFINAPANYFDSNTKLLHYINNKHSSLAQAKWFVYDDAGTSKYMVRTDEAMYAKLYLLTTNQTLTTGVAAKVNFNGKAKDTWGMGDEVTNYNITAPSDGTYMIGGKLSFAASTVGLRAAFVYINGTVYDNNGAIQVIGENVMIWNEPIELNQGDVITIEAQQDSGGNLDILAFSNDSRSNFYMYKITD